MKHNLVGCSLLLLGVVFVACGVAVADPPGHEAQPRLAMPSETKGNVGYHVGGGNLLPRFAAPRDAEEGTWGWDYQGWLLPRRILNGWWHGRRSQVGTGAYKTDGPKLHP